MSSFDAVRKLALAAVLTLVVAGFSAAHTPPAAMARLRSSVTLLLAVDSGAYRDRMDDADCTRSCDTLLKRLDDGIRRALASEYPFIDWTDRSGSARDTIMIRWQDGAGAAFLGTQLEFRWFGAGANKDSNRVVVAFESDSAMTERKEEEWQPARLEAEWLSQMPQALRGNDLLQRVFGRVPINAAVVFSHLPRVTVPAPPDSIRAARPHPAFELEVRVKYAPEQIDDTGKVLLKECSKGGAGYTCPVAGIQLDNRTFRSDTLLDMLRTESVKWLTTRVTRFTPRPNAVDATPPRR